MQSSPRLEEVTMATSIERAPLDLRRDATARTTRISARQALLACGIVYALLYVIVNDVIAATLYDGYSRMSQAVSELSATGAPTHALLTAVGPVFSLLLIGFGLGIWRSARGKRSLRIAGALVVAHGATSFLWLLGPMSQREVIAAGGATSADDLHLVLAAATSSWARMWRRPPLGWDGSFGSTRSSRSQRRWCSDCSAGRSTSWQRESPLPGWVCSSASVSGCGLCGWPWLPWSCGEPTGARK